MLIQHRNQLAPGIRMLPPATRAARSKALKCFHGQHNGSIQALECLSASVSGSFEAFGSAQPRSNTAMSSAGSSERTSKAGTVASPVHFTWLAWSAWRPRPSTSGPP